MRTERFLGALSACELPSPPCCSVEHDQHRKRRNTEDEPGCNGYRDSGDVRRRDTGDDPFATRIAAMAIPMMTALRRTLYSLTGRKYATSSNC
jgi:hypothetical protein